MSEPLEPSNNAVPLFGTWRKAYLVVVVVFLLDVAIFYGISCFFA